MMVWTVVAGLLVGGCSSGEPEPDPLEPGDPREALALVAEARETSGGDEPESFAQVLDSVAGRGSQPWADLVFTGVVSRVDHSPGSDEVELTAIIDWGSSGESGDEVEFRMPAHGDADRYVASLQGLGDRWVFGVLVDDGDARRVVMDGALLGWVADDGALDLPGLGEGRDGFLRRVRTLDAVHARLEGGRVSR